MEIEEMNNEPVAWQGLIAEEIATIPNDEFRLQTVERILKERNTHPAKTDKYIADLKNLVDAQGQDGTWNSDRYMLGLFNGLELALSIFESREPKFRELSAKTLTDEEITEVATIHLGHSMGLLSWMSFARAILKKVSEK